MTASINDGLRAAARHPKLVLLIWAWYALLALIPAIPAWVWWNAVLGYSPEGASVLRRFDLGVFLDMTAGKGIDGIGLLTGAAAAVGLVALVSSAFAFGGILEVLASGNDRRSFMHRFFRGGGHFFWRFFRLAIIAGVCLVLATGAVSALETVLVSAAGESEWEPAGYLAGLVSIVMFLVVAGFFLLALDYARIRVARDGARSMFKAYAAGLWFVVRRLLPAYGIAIAILVFEVALVVGYLAYETKAPAAGTWGAIVVLFAFQQVVIFGRVFLRVALVGAERHFFMAMVPKPVLAEATEFAAPPASVPLESAAPEQEQIPT